VIGIGPPFADVVPGKPDVASPLSAVTVGGGRHGELVVRVVICWTVCTVRRRLIEVPAVGEGELKALPVLPACT